MLSIQVQIRNIVLILNKKILKIKDFTFKFFIDNKKAQVQLDIEPSSEEKRKIYFEKIESLKTILVDNYLANAILERNYYLDTGKVISRIWVEKLNVSSSNPATWQDVFDFFNKNMSNFEDFFIEYQDYIYCQKFRIPFPLVISFWLFFHHYIMAIF